MVYSGESVGEQIGEDEVKPYNQDELSQYATIPEKTKQYYKEEIAAGRRPLLFHGVPHILLKGSINTAELAKIEG